MTDLYWFFGRKMHKNYQDFTQISTHMSLIFNRKIKNMIYFSTRALNSWWRHSFHVSLHSDSSNWKQVKWYLRKDYTWQKKKPQNCPLTSWSAEGKPNATFSKIHLYLSQSIRERRNSYSLHLYLIKSFNPFPGFTAQPCAILYWLCLTAPPCGEQLIFFCFFFC